MDEGAGFVIVEYGVRDSVFVVTPHPGHHVPARNWGVDSIRRWKGVIGREEMLTALGEDRHYGREQKDDGQAKRLVCFHPIVQVEYISGVEGMGELSMLSDLFRDSAPEDIDMLGSQHRPNQNATQLIGGRYC